MRVYLAGGAVRDILLGRIINDRDYLVMGSTKEEFVNTFPLAKEVGLAFPVFLLDGMEFSFPRAPTLTQEIKSRDLTVNAMLLNEDGDIICHPQSLEDIHNKILRPTSLEALIEDPLRVIRAARFWAMLPDFTPHDELLEGMRHVEKSGLLSTIAPDRIGQETRKALQAPVPGNFLRLLAQANCLEPWFTEFKESLNIPAGPLPYHDTNVLEHICRTMDGLAGDEASVWMGLCHDIGKTLTPQTLLPSHYGHDKKGIQLALNLARRLRLPNKLVLAGHKASQWHMTAARYPELRPTTKVNLLMDLHQVNLIHPLFTLVLIDHNENFIRQAERDLTRILSIKLSPHEMNRGAESGKRLRELRAAALIKK